MFEKYYRTLFPLFVVLVLSSTAQDRSCYGQQRPYVPIIPPKDTSMFWIFKDVSAGPYFTGGISRQNEKLPVEKVAGDSLAPWRADSRFAFAVGGSINFSINSWIGLAFTALYDSR